MRATHEQNVCRARRCSRMLLSACNTTKSRAGLTLRVQCSPKSQIRVRYLSGCRKYSKMLWLYGQLAPRTHTLSCKQRCAADRGVSLRLPCV